MEANVDVCRGFDITISDILELFFDNVTSKDTSSIKYLWLHLYHTHIDNFLIHIT